MRDGNHNLKVSVETLSGFVYKHEKQTNGSQLVVKDEDGKILHQGEFKSFTANFMRLLFGNMIDGTPTAKAKSLDDSDVTITDIPVCKMNFKGGSGVQKFGVCVGNGLGAVANSDYALGFVSGLTYGATVVGTPSVVGSTIKLDITREISNTSGGAITLQESGLVCGVKPEDNDNNVLVARDLVVVSLANNKKSTWTYSIVVSFDGTAGGFVKNFLDSFIIDWTTFLANGHSQWSKRQYHQCLVFADKMWIIGGYAYSNDVLSSSDGITWTTVLADGHSQWSRRFSHQCIVFDSKMWIIGGYDGAYLNDVFSSPDGVTWTTVLADGHSQWSRRPAHQCLVFDSKMWIIGGGSGTNFNDVLSSSNGITWTTVLADGHSQWRHRQYHQCLVFDSKMWIIGGYDGAYLNDVFSSPDGVTWTTVLADGHSQWSRRRIHQCLVFDSKMWIIGGGSGTNFNDVLSSSNGITWTTVLADGHSQWSRRFAHQCIVFADKMWIIGGNDGSNLNDVWSWGKQLSSNALITDDTLGIVVGASDTAFTSTDTALATKIEHGTGATQVEYGVFPDTSVTTEPAISGGKTTMKLARNFINNSGSSITIKEVGIMSENGLLCRVLIPSPFIVVANGASEVISFVFETEV